MRFLSVASANKFAQSKTTLTFIENARESEFIYFYYGQRYLRVIVFVAVACIVWLAFLYLDIQAYSNERLSFGLKIFQFIARGAFLLPMIICDILLCLPFVQRRPFVAEVFLCTSLVLVLSGSAILTCSQLPMFDPPNIPKVLNMLILIIL